MKILIIGLGAIGIRHYNILKNLIPQASFAFLSNSFKKNNDYKNVLIYNKINDAIKFEPTLAVIANPSSLHLKYAKVFISIKSNIFIEKPISNILNQKATLELYNLANLYKKNIFLGYNLIFDNSYIFFSKILKKSNIKKIVHTQITTGSSLKKWRKHIHYSKSVSAIKKKGGGVLLELSHELNNAINLFGFPNWINASLINSKILKTNVEDLASITLGYNNKFPNDNFLININLDFIRQDATREIIVIFEHKTIKWNGILQTVDLYDDKKKKWVNLFKSTFIDNDNSYKNMWKYNLKKIGKDFSDNQVIILNSINILYLIDKIRLSSKSGKKINLKKINKL